MSLNRKFYDLEHFADLAIALSVPLEGENVTFYVKSNAIEWVSYGKPASIKSIFNIYRLTAIICVRHKVCAYTGAASGLL